jgi:CubicO group peptidase (beta-lactamase class C family)
MVQTRRAARTCTAVLLLLLLTAAGPAAGQVSPPLAELDAIIEQGLREWEVPGLAVAVVRGDSVLLARGYGVRNVETGAPVDSATVFGIMSMTKAFTATAMAMLVDDGLVEWDRRVTDYLPAFRVYDDWVTRNVTIRDLLSHRMAVERGDFLWYGTGHTREEIVHRVRHLRPVGEFRALYGYSNNMYITAGQLIARVTGRSWDDIVAHRIFAPLGMRSSGTTIRFMAGRENRASPHEVIDGRLQPIPYRSLDNEGPGGSINSNVLDLARWARFQLADGAFDGERLVSEEALLETRTPQTLIQVGDAASRLNPGIHFSAYGFGWQIQDYRGRKLVQHSGGIDGQRSRIALMPEESLAVIVLTNRGRGNLLFDAVRNHVLDRFLDAEDEDWNAVFLAFMREQRAEAERAEEELRQSRVRGTEPSLPQEAYTGLYADSAYGEATVELHDGDLVLRIGPELRGTMEHWHYDTFRVVWEYGYNDPVLARFDLDSTGRVETLALPGWWPSFDRVGDLVPYVGGPR